MHDDDVGAKIQMLREMVSDRLPDLTNVPPLFAKMMERRRSADNPTSDTEFKDVKHLRNFDPYFVVSFVAGR